ncbi:hydroxyacylglutathione hydrolase [Paucibacter sp. KBW04]|uniref:hydroxyacylglutathione hydrolase n=1 Tax=Paucibacter sp. KBW04 TaxID=2153361 RepID=UPI000F57D4DC|nr:hydroxyacylglutathione hydrolase [Paucibacter sp. KBW04]RQO56333.1 hydroxyacylglutathione hydrolase [Paucibacter sp. KBW04]
MERVAPLSIAAIPAFADNYIWMIHDGQQALVVDPGDAAPVFAALAAQSLRLGCILVSHHHPDHVGGVAALREAFSVPVYGPAREPMPEPCIRVSEGESLSLLGREFQVLEVPGHTAGHIAFLLAQPNAGEAPALFCGDTLFSGGCGRLFEGTPAQMHQSLQKLAALPADTRVFCTHEYTLANLRFARHIEPDNKALRDYQAWCEQQRAQDLPTLPSTLALELQINPFLRCGEASVRAAVLQGQPDSASTTLIDIFGRLRQWKNDFR